MPDTKISPLSALTGANTVSNDEYLIQDVSIPETRKQTRAELFQNIPACDFRGANVWNDAGANLDQRMEGDTDPNLLFLDASTDRIGFGTNTPTAKVQVNGSFAFGAPVVITAAYTVGDNDTVIINNRTANNTITLPTPANNTGRMLWFVNWHTHTVSSASSNVVPFGGGAAGTAILGNKEGAMLQCDGTSWIIISKSA